MKFLNYMTEAVIRTANLDVIEDRIKKVFDSLRTYNLLQRCTLIPKALQKEFIDMDLQFAPGYHSPDEILGFTFPDGVISIDIGVGRFSSKDDKLIGDLMGVLKHELVHREQLKKSSGHSSDKAKGMSSINAENIDTYLADKMELMAYAVQIVTLLRNEKYTDAQIIDMLRNPKKWIANIVKSESHLEIYMNIFDKNSATIKRLKKYIIEYLDDK